MARRGGENPALNKEAVPLDRWEYEIRVQRDRITQLRSVYNDLALGLPQSVTLPESYRRRVNVSLRHSQQSEYRKCIRPPPNRTVFDIPPDMRESPPELPSGPSEVGGGTRRPGMIFGLKLFRRREGPPSPESSISSGHLSPARLSGVVTSSCQEGPTTRRPNIL